MQAIVDPVYFKRTVTISPGVVGSVGDALGGVRLKQSTPDMPMRYEAAFSGANAPITGSNVQDGFSYSYSSGGGPAKTLEKTWANRGFRTNHGWTYQDLRAPDTTLEPVMGSLGRYNWYNKIATVYEAKRTGDLFLPLPGAYGPKDITRGSQVPRVVESINPTDKFLSPLGKQLTEDASQNILRRSYMTRCYRRDGTFVDRMQERMQQIPTVVTNENRPGPPQGGAPMPILLQAPAAAPVAAPQAPQAAQEQEVDLGNIRFF